MALARPAKLLQLRGQLLDLPSQLLDLLLQSGVLVKQIPIARPTSMSRLGSHRTHTRSTMKTMLAAQLLRGRTSAKSVTNYRQFWLVHFQVTACLHEEQVG